MRTSLPGILTTLVVWGVTPIAAFAACENYDLTDDQLAYLDGQSLEIAIPDGEVPIVQRCDINLDDVVDINDIRAISLARNQPAAHPDDPMDWDKNNYINLLDARGCQLACTYPRCRPGDPVPRDPSDDNVDVAECFQTEDIDGDGTQDFVGIYEHTGEEERVGNWNLDVVILYKDENNETKHITYPYTGQSVTDGESTELYQHLSSQPAGQIDLNPGSLTIDTPAVVSYRNGKPKVLYYWKDGKIRRALYGVDD